MRSSQLKFRFVQYLEEDLKKPVYSVKFNPFVDYDMFATVSRNRITVYKVIDNQIVPVLCFADPNEEEEFFCCDWALDKNSEISLLAAGKNGIIRIISPKNSSQGVKYLSGHGGAINEIKVNPQNSEIILSASQDHSLRLWNIRTDVCIAIFAGVEGHRDQVLSADFHNSGKKIVSCGMDHSLKIWNFTDDILKAIDASSVYDDATSRMSFPTVRKHFPTFSTRDIHRNYVDCVAWYGNFILSKSCENKIICWRPGKLENSVDLSLPSKYTTDTTCSIMENYDVKDNTLWFIRFSIDSNMKYLVLGSTKGKIYIFDLDTHDHDCKPIDRYILTHPKLNNYPSSNPSENGKDKNTVCIRNTCFNNTANMLICTGENGTIWRWDVVKNE